MPTPKSWYRDAERILELEKAGKVRLEPEYEVKRRDSAENVTEARLFAVSLVSDPLPGYGFIRTLPEGEIVSASTPKGSSDFYDQDEADAIDRSAFFGITDPGD